MLKQFNQKHILQTLSQLNEEDKENLLLELNSFDLEVLMKLFNSKDKTQNNIQAITPIMTKELSEIEKQKYKNIGLDAIINHEIAVVLMAGGQGTRLGHKGPKGTFDIGLTSKKSLFELHCDELHKLYKITKTYIPWYIMTSEENHEETLEFFKSNNYFNYPKTSIIFFKQDRLPLLLDNGLLAMSGPSHLNLAANGNGGVFTSLKTNHLIKDMQKKGVQYVFLYGVDNALAKLADPIFVGFMKEKNFDISSKAVDKVDASEKVGVMCYKNSKPAIVEYSELEDDMRHAVDEKGTLIYRHANILAHLFKLEFINKCADLKLPYHMAHKKVNYYMDQEYITAEKPNGYKFELFMFDVFEHANDMAVLTVNRNEEFAPVKNKDGFDSPETARKLYNLLNNQKGVT